MTIWTPIILPTAAWNDLTIEQQGFFWDGFIWDSGVSWDAYTWTDTTLPLDSGVWTEVIL